MAGGGFRTAAKVKGLPVTNTVVIKIKNFGTCAETEVRYTVTATCVDANFNGTLDCVPGSITFSAACTGDAAALNGGSIAPNGTVSIPGCTVTYTAPTGGDQWLLTLLVSHCGADGFTDSCTTNDGGIDFNTSNNISTRKVSVSP